MGGKALKNTFTRRYDKPEYEKIAVVVRNFLQLNLWTRVEIVKAYKDKKDFGDLDVLVKTPFTKQLSEDFFKELFGSTEIVHNGPVWSFDFKEFQVDAIMTHESYFDYAMGYFSFNDLGNLVGRITHSLGLKHGHEGLYLPVRNGDNLAANLLITTNHSETLEFLGLDVARFELGFDNLEDIFNYVVSSKYFDPDIYLMHNRNHASRVRDAKRPTYTKFLKWLEDTKTQAKFVADRENKSVYLPLIWDKWPHKEKEYDAIRKTMDDKKARREKFNGQLVSDLTGLKGKDLGGFMTHLKTVLTDADIDSFEELTLHMKILSSYELYKNT